MPITIQLAESADADKMAVLLRRSIVELCDLDHCSDAEKFQPWLTNKTAENVQRWIAGPGRVFCATDQDRRLVGVGMGAPNGEVLLNYVLPEARFLGVSKALMSAIENYFCEVGVAISTLKSTGTAEKLYRSIGYQETGEVEVRRGMTFKQFEKALQT
jgi:GNAT superfamily N-acetyltransferase